MLSAAQVLAGTVAMRGARAVTGAGGGTLEPLRIKPFVLEFEGVGFDASDRLAFASLAVAPKPATHQKERG